MHCSIGKPRAMPRAMSANDGATWALRKAQGEGEGGIGAITYGEMKREGSRSMVLVFWSLLFGVNF